VGSGTFLKVVRPHKITSGDLFSIGKDLNFILVIDKQQLDTVKPVMNNPALMQNMFNET
jgi:hypothetical protein